MQMQEKKKTETQFINQIKRNLRLLQFDPQSNRYILTLMLKERPVVLKCYECDNIIFDSNIYFCKEMNAFFHRDCLIEGHRPKVDTLDPEHIDYAPEIILSLKDKPELNYIDFFEKWRKE